MRVSINGGNPFSLDGFGSGKSENHMDESNGTSNLGNFHRISGVRILHLFLDQITVGDGPRVLCSDPLSEQIVNIHHSLPYSSKHLLRLYLEWFFGVCLRLLRGYLEH